MRALALGLMAATLLGVPAAVAAEREDYVRAPMPPEFHVESTEIAGPVFADARGRTLYRWPLHDLRNGDVGEYKGKPTCDDHVYTENSGLMSPYPPGLELPEVATRPSCIQVWPPVYADADAKPIGAWTVLKRRDGRLQWAYDGFALYTSILDRRPGDVIGGVSGTGRRPKTDAPAVREAAGPPPNIPAVFNLTQVATGRLLSAYAGYSVYTSDRDQPNKSNCDAACLKQWAPVLAPQPVADQGEWSVIERSPGIRQWAFRKKPLYTRIDEENFRSLEGSDVAGWHNVYTQRAPTPPREFTVQDTRAGQVLADKHGMTIYLYHCADDALDQLACDHPDTTQVYRLAVCGDGDQATCLKTFPYVIADRNARSDTRAWSVMDIDPATGHRAKPGQADVLHVWAYNDRPVYTFAKDHRPGDINADAWGEFHGKRNGFKAFWLRDDFRNNTE